MVNETINSSPMRPACLPPSSMVPTSNVSSCPPGGAISGMEPTVDTVAVQPVPAYWYYVLAGGGALLLLVTVTVVVILCRHRYHWAPKKTSGGHHHHHHHHHSVTYRNSQHPIQQGHQNYTQNQNLSYNLIHSPDQNHLYPGTGPSLDPMLTIRLEKDDGCDSQCWKRLIFSECFVIKQQYQHNCRSSMMRTHVEETLQFLSLMTDLINF